MYECDWLYLYKTDTIVKQHLRESSPYKMPLRDGRLFEIIKYGSLFGFVHCDIKVHKNLRESFASIPPIFKNINVSRHDIVPPIKELAEKEGLLTNPRRMLISSYFSENGTIITPLLLFYLDLGMVCKKTYRLVQYTPRKCFNNCSVCSEC